MKLKTAILLFIVIGVFIVGCQRSGSTGYATYNQQQGQQQPYVGGGCGVAPNAAYEDTPVKALDSADSAL